MPTRRCGAAEEFGRAPTGRCRDFIPGLPYGHRTGAAETFRPYGGAVRKALPTAPGQRPTTQWHPGPTGPHMAGSREDGDGDRDGRAAADDGPGGDRTGADA
ncbi:hypothetical protein Srufu_029290 [Streptomyces libani subsp. rufus]|nr:hypothetical protein Srufu_029290 [Streptomyces libani subsp. rufus]